MVIHRSDLRQRAYNSESDWLAIDDLIATDLAYHHRVDFPWRLCSPALENHLNATIGTLRFITRPWIGSRSLPMVTRLGFAFAGMTRSQKRARLNRLASILIFSRWD